MDNQNYDNSKNNKNYEYNNYQNPHNQYNYNNLFYSKLMNKNKQNIIIKYLIILVKLIIYTINIRELIQRIFYPEKFVIYYLNKLKNFIKKKFPKTNIVFKDKSSSLLLNYIHYTSSYYISQNNDSEYYCYKSILEYTIYKETKNIKYKCNQDGEIVYFDINDDINIYKDIYINTSNSINHNSNNYAIELYSFTYSQNDLRKFMNNCVKKYSKKINNNAINHKQSKYYKYLGNANNQNMFELYEYYSSTTFDNLFFKKKDLLINKLNFFIKGEKMYRELGIPYTCGILLYGPPGTGKSSCMKAAAQFTDRYIIEVNFNVIKTNKELRSIFYDKRICNENIPQNKRIYIFDEFDLIIDKIKERKNKENDQDTLYDNENLNNLINSNNNNNQNLQKNMYNNKKYNKDEITLDCLLNLLDGVPEQSGCIYIAATNYIDKIDKSLKRPGRFDCQINLDNIDKNILIDMISHFYKKRFNETLNIGNELDDIDKFLYYENKNVWSPAKISQICLLYLDDKDNYIKNIIRDIKNSYNEEILLLN